MVILFPPGSLANQGRAACLSDDGPVSTFPASSPTIASQAHSLNCSEGLAVPRPAVKSVPGPQQDPGHLAVVGRQIKIDYLQLCLELGKRLYSLPRDSGRQRGVRFW